ERRDVQTGVRVGRAIALLDFTRRAANQRREPLTVGLARALVAAVRADHAFARFELGVAELASAATGTRVVALALARNRHAGGCRRARVAVRLVVATADWVVFEGASLGDLLARTGRIRRAADRFLRVRAVFALVALRADQTTAGVVRRARAQRAGDQATF